MQLHTNKAEICLSQKFLRERKSMLHYFLPSITHVMVEKLFWGQNFEVEILMVLQRYEDP